MILENPAFIALVAGLPSIMIALLAYRRSRRKDLIAERAGIATTQSTSISQVVDAMDRHLDNLRVDNADLRTQIKELQERVEFLEDQIHRYRVEDEDTASTRLGEDVARATERADEQKEEP